MSTDLWEEAHMNDSLRREIERLRATNAGNADEIQQLIEEVHRLRADLKQAWAERDQYLQSNVTLTDSQRLTRALNKELVGMLETVVEDWPNMLPHEWVAKAHAVIVKAME
jgi:predicted RNase H-like nuclease (RuvC/YqgF family)